MMKKETSSNLKKSEKSQLRKALDALAFLSRRIKKESKKS